MHSINYSMFMWLKGQKSLGKKNEQKQLFTPWRGDTLLIRTTKERLTPQVRGKAASQFFAKLPGAAVCLDIPFSKCSSLLLCILLSKNRRTPSHYSKLPTKHTVSLNTFIFKHKAFHPARLFISATSVSRFPSTRCFMAGSPFVNTCPKSQLSRLFCPGWTPSVKTLWIKGGREWKENIGCLVEKHSHLDWLTALWCSFFLFVFWLFSLQIVLLHSSIHGPCVHPSVPDHRLSHF